MQQERLRGYRARYAYWKPDTAVNIPFADKIAGYRDTASCFQEKQNLLLFDLNTITE